MLDQLLKIVKENAGDVIVSNPAIPDHRNEEAIQTAAKAMLTNLKGMASQGDLNNILNMLNGKGDASGSPLINNLSSGVAGELMKKFGINSADAAAIVNKLIPVVMQKLGNKANDPNDNSINLDAIVGALSGKSGGGLLGTLAGLLRKRR